MEGGRQAMARLLAGPVMPTAVFAGSDEMAFGALDLLRSAGVTVPGDLSVVGFDNHDLAEVMGLSTVDQGARVQGEAAARAVLDAVAGPAEPSADLVLPIRLVLRGSTAPPHPLRGRAPAATV